MKLTSDLRPMAIVAGGVKAVYDREQEAMRILEARKFELKKLDDPNEDRWLRDIFGFVYRQREPYVVDANGVAHVYILGAVSKGLPPLYCYLEETDYDDVRAELAEAYADKSVRAIMLHINSPGGSITGLPELAAYIHAIRSTKPVFAWIDEMACSAAQWIAAACSAIYVSPSAEVGSIGVILARLDYSKMLDAEGIVYELIVPEECDLKASFWPVNPLTEEQRASLVAMVEKTNQQFRGAIEEYRGITLDKSLARGQVIDADDALAGGLIDAVCDYETCYADLLSVAPPLETAEA